MKLRDKETCTGCGLCVNVCPNGCIKMKRDQEGFYFPVIHQQQCLDCGLCKKACFDMASNPKKEVRVYAAYQKAVERRLKASSGGIFELLAEEVLNRKGVVFGVKMEGLKAVHTHIEKKQELEPLLGSKYVQSDVGCSYQQVQVFLKQKRWVLFSGTPCQVDALIKYLGGKSPYLLTVDFICHGVSSPNVFEKYMSEHKIGHEKINQISFRDKTEGWNCFSMAMTTENGQVYRENMHKDSYLQSFLKNMNLRLSCFNCAFRTVDRVSDVTLGDFWECENIWSDWKDDKGYSLVFIQSEKGKMFFDIIQEAIVSKEADIEKVLTYNQSMLVSPWDQYSRDLFFKYIQKETVEKSMMKVEKEGLHKKIGRKWWKICRKIK